MGLLLASLAGCGQADLPGVEDLQGDPANPFAETSAKATVAIFVDSDCPVSNRYAPEVRRLHDKFTGLGVKFWLVYPDPGLPARSIRQHMEEYGYPMQALRDPQHSFVHLAKAQVTPEAGIFLPDGTLVYHGRIDDRYVDFGRQRAAATRHDVEEILDAVISGRSPDASFSPAAGRPLGALSQPGIGCFIRDFR
jgi:hypothetical protein